MKKMMSLGCLLALAFAGASAFATTWFENAVGETTANVTKDSTTIGTWTVTGVDGGWTWTSGADAYGTLKDWTDGVKFTANPAKTMASEDVTFTTEVNFTSAVDFLDLPDLTTDEYADVKGGLTVVEVPESDPSDPPSYAYYGIIKRSGVKVWEPLASVTPKLGTFVTVKVALINKGDATAIKYSVDDTILSDGSVDAFEMAYTDFSINSVEFKGMCQLKSLGGLAYNNAPTAKEEITPSVAGVPTKISYNRQDLLERGIDPDDVTAVTTYLTTERLNGLCGWVNTALGIDDNKPVSVESNVCAVGSITLDYGFITNGTGAVSYIIDTDEEAKDDATISTTESGIHTVRVWVTGEDGTTQVMVREEQVGVMNTGKDTTDVPTNEKTFDIVAVPFASFKGEVTVANVLNTAELSEGDVLYILRDNQYDTFVLDKEGKWRSTGGTTYGRGEKADGAKAANTETDPEKYVLVLGTAIWIERAKGSKIVFAGVGEKTANHYAAVLAGEYNLVANPTINAFDLSAAKCKFALEGDADWDIREWEDLGSVGDRIIVEDVAAPIQYEKTESGWGSWETRAKRDNNNEVIKIRNHEVMETVFVPGGEIPAGIGFWYKNNGSTDLTIDFGTNATPTEP